MSSLLRSGHRDSYKWHQIITHEEPSLRVHMFNTQDQVGYSGSLQYHLASLGLTGPDVMSPKKDEVNEMLDSH